MPRALRKILSAGAVSALLAGGVLTSGIATAAPATADQVDDECAAATTQLTVSEDALDAAEQAYDDSRRPTGELVAAAQAQARAEVRSSKIALKRLRAQLATARDKTRRTAIRRQIAAEQKDVRAGAKVLASRHAALARIRLDRATARAAYAEALSSMEDAQEAEDDACFDEELEGDDPGDDDSLVTDAPDDGDDDGVLYSGDED